MQQRCILLSAQIAAIKRNPEILQSNGMQIDTGSIDMNSLVRSEFLLSPAVLVMRAVHANRYSEALSVASSLKVDMTDLFTNLTQQCIRLSRNPQAYVYVPNSIPSTLNLTYHFLGLLNLTGCSPIIRQHGQDPPLIVLGDS